MTLSATQAMCETLRDLTQINLQPITSRFERSSQSIEMKRYTASPG